MKRMFLSLGLSVTILLSAAFAQGTMQKATAPAAKSTVELTSQKQLPLTRKTATKRINPNASVSKTSFQPVACYKSKANPDKAVVKLINGMDWGDGTGYQVLLDNKHEFISQLNEYGQINQETVRDLYTAATTTIPDNAQPELTGSIIEFGEVDSAVIDPGTYDMIVTNPSPGTTEEVHVYVAGNGSFDDIEFEEGMTYVFNVISGGSGDYVKLLPEWNVVLANVNIPMANCQTTEVPVTMKVTNDGKYTITNFTATYCLLAVEGDTIGEVVEETFTANLAAGASEEFVFEKKIEFAEDDDVVYVVFTEIAPIESEEDDEDLLEDNYAESLLVRKTAVDVPADFVVDEFDLSFSLDAWDMYEDGDDVVLEGLGLPDYPAITRCINMEAGETYRLSYDRILGFNFWGIFAVPVSYKVLFGKVGDEISTWRSLYFGEELYDQEFSLHELSVNVTEAGEYAFAFVEDTSSMGGGVILKNIHVGTVLGNDVKLNAFSAAMPHLMPLEHAAGSYKASATITNYGKNNIEKATLKIMAGADKLFEEEVALGKADTTVTKNFDITVNFNKIGKAELTATVSIANDEDPTNNEFKTEVEVTDKVMAYDYVTEDMYTSEHGVGSSGGAIGCGIPFTIAKRDTLTGVSLGWSPMENDMDVEICIYKWNAATNSLGDMLYRETVRRGMEAGQREYKVPALMLEPGAYMISAHQITGFYSLICDGNPNGILYITTADPVAAQTNLGYPAIRAIFGHDGKPVAKDLAVKEISKPAESGLFTSEEPIVVKVRNNGYEAVEAPLTVMVNKDNLTAQTVKLAAYAEAEYTFKGDLSASDAEFVLTATVSLEGDENAENNTLTKTVHSLPPVDPYTMNFEYCADFALDNDLVMWKGVLGPGAEGIEASYGFNGISFPHSGEVFAFIAYNGSKTTPETETGVAHGGERFGASFAWDGGANDAWLVSPQLTLASEGANMKFYAKAIMDDYGPELYNVLISTTDNKLTSFEKIGATREATAANGWEEVTIDLSAYNGKAVYLAIQCVSNDVFVFMIDDIVVKGSAANEGKATNIRLNAWPNPAKEMVYISADQVIEQVSIYTPAGNMIYQSADNMKAEEFRYNVNKLSSGLYIARVKTAQGTGVVKFVVR